MACIKIKNGYVCVSREFKPGDLLPDGCGYLDQQEWHEVQHRAGLRQSKCGVCSRYKYPQEMSEKTIKSKYQKTKYGPELTETKHVCKKCL